MVRRSPWISPFAVITGWTLWFTIIPCSRAQVSALNFEAMFTQGCILCRLIPGQRAVSANEDGPASSWQSPAPAT